VFDFTELQSFITSNNFTKLTYIGDISELNQSLTTFCGNNSIQYTYYNVGGDSLTIPYIEDGDDILIIRSAYDTTAIIDDTYCADKGNFVELVQSSTFGLQYAMLDSNGTLKNTITSIPDNGQHPNFILKPRFPRYDNNVYPKLFKVSTQDELNQVISNNLTNNYILTEFLYNSDKLFNNTHIQVIRSYNLLYPPTLQSITIGQNTQIPAMNVSILVPSYDNTTFELSNEFRNRYITGIVTNGGFPKLISTDKIELADGTWKAPNELNLGDVVKTIVFPNPNNANPSDEFANFNMDYATFTSGLTYTSATISYISEISTFIKMAKITFDDGTSWEDGEFVNFLTVRNNEVRWIMGTSLIAGDQIIAVQTNQTSSASFDSLLKTVSSVEMVSNIFDGWVVSVDSEDHCYIVKDTIDNNSFALFEHNYGCGACASCNGQCYNCPSKSQPYCSTTHICFNLNC